MKHLFSKVISVLLVVCMIAVPLSASAYTYNGPKTVTNYSAEYTSNTTFDCYLEDGYYYSVTDNSITDWFQTLTLNVEFSDNTSVKIVGADAINESVINGKSFSVEYNDDNYLKFGKNEVHIYYADFYVTILITINMIYSDVAKESWFYDSVLFANNNQIMNGTSRTTFAPNVLLTRSMFVTMLYRLYGEDEDVGSYAQPFSDVQNSWYTDAVKWAYHSGVVDGTSATTFSPDVNITREQMCKMMASFCSFCGYTLKEGALTFTDASKISPWAKTFVAQCYNSKIVNGKGDSRFDPQGKASRAEAATVIMNAANNVFTDVHWIS